jgi:hypothetical protein
MSAPLVVNTTDGTVWTRREHTLNGAALYAVAGAAPGVPAEVMLTLPELTALGIAGSADVLPMPVGPSAVEVSVDKLTALLAPTQALAVEETKTACRCDEPDSDPYSCEADDCTYEFSELNPFGGSRPVDVASAEVSRKCDRCGWRSSVWHVDDGSAEAELYEHSTTMHGAEGGASC